MKIRTLTLVVLIQFALFPALANNLDITNLALANDTGTQVDLRFDVSWENSWRETWTDNGGVDTVTNWDAVWLFAKVRQSGGLWKHVKLTAVGHTAPAGMSIDPATDANGTLGVFLQRTGTGSGNVNATGVRLRWDYGAAGLTTTNELDITVLGIEMVYIPEGAFHLGSGGNETAHFHYWPDQASTFVVTSEAALVVANQSNRLSYVSSGASPYTLGADYPKGYQAFYCMKYECSQEQYADYLNLLDPPVAAARYVGAGSYNGWRYTIHLTNGTYVADAPDRACNYVDWNDSRLYLDWSGLRPLTELEFEKACRGVRAPVVNEYPWGTTSYTRQTGVSGTDGSGTETKLPTNANCSVQDVITGPSRCGIFATPTSDRVDAGAGYYGVMELGGNLWEFTLGAHQNAIGFAGTHGDGDEYSPLPVDWPTSSNAYGIRGGSWDDSNVGHLRTSDRAGWASPQSRERAKGFRGVRTAP